MLTIPNERIAVLINGQDHKITVNDLEFEYEYQRLGGGGPLKANFAYCNCDFHIPIFDYVLIKEGDLLAVDLKMSDIWENRLQAFMTAPRR